MWSGFPTPLSVRAYCTIIARTEEGYFGRPAETAPAVRVSMLGFRSAERRVAVSWVKGPFQRQALPRNRFWAKLLCSDRAAPRGAAMLAAPAWDVCAKGSALPAITGRGQLSQLLS